MLVFRGVIGVWKFIEKNRKMPNQAGEGRFPFEVGHLGHTWCQPPNWRNINKKQLKSFTALAHGNDWLSPEYFLSKKVTVHFEDVSSLRWRFFRKQKRSSPKSLKPTGLQQAKWDNWLWWSFFFVHDVRVDSSTPVRCPDQCVFFWPDPRLDQICFESTPISICMEKKEGVREEWRKHLFSKLNRLFCGDYSEVYSEVNFMSLCWFWRDISKSPHVMDNWITQRYLGHQQPHKFQFASSSSVYIDYRQFHNHILDSRDCYGQSQILPWKWNSMVGSDVFPIEIVPFLGEKLVARFSGA